MKVRLGILKEYFREQFVSVLFEGRVEDAREKYPDMEEEAFDYLVANQPAGSNNKYLMWTCKQADELLENDPDLQGLVIVIQAVRLFDGNKQRLEKKDLNQYKDTAEIEAAIEKLGGPSKNKQAQQAKADSDVVYQDTQFLVLRPHTTESSCKYGIGTKWCIAATASRNYFHSYSSSNNKFYFVIDKNAQANAASSKFAIVILDAVSADTSRIQVFDATDKQVGLQAVIRHTGDKWSEIWSKIKEHVASHPITREVEESRKAAEEHVKTLLKGEKVSREGLLKIARDSKLTGPIVTALIRNMRAYTGPADYTDPRSEVIGALAGRAAQLTAEGAMMLINFVISTKPAGDTYWSGRYHLETIIKNAPLGPENFREMVQSGDESLISHVIANPNLPDDIKTQLGARIDEFQSRDLRRGIYRALIKSGTITPEQMQTAMNPDYYLASDILHHPEMSANLSPELLRLVPVRSGEDLKKFLTLPNVPADLVADLISQYWGQLKKSDLYQMLKTVNLPTELIERIWDNKDQHIRVSLLQNSAIGVDNASRFARSQNSAYRFAVAHNTALPVEDIDLLATDESASTRAAAGANPKAAQETLTRLARDEATVVRASVASNPTTPANILQALKRDSDDFVRKSARKTLKSLEVAEAIIVRSFSMQATLLREDLSDDSDMQDIMTPDWSEIRSGSITVQEFFAIVLLQNNGSATWEEIEAAFGQWGGRPRNHGHGRGYRQTTGHDIWSIMKSKEKFDDKRSRTTTAGGPGWFWSPAGINKGSIFRLTPAGASAAMSALAKVRADNPGTRWASTTRPTAPVKKSPPAAELTPRVPGAAPAPRGPKTTYKIYGRFKGHPASTRLKGQAYVGAANTQFSAGEQAEISPADDGKLKVKKVGSDHTQTWEPIDG